MHCITFLTVFVLPALTTQQENMNLFPIPVISLMIISGIFKTEAAPHEREDILSTPSDQVQRVLHREGNEKSAKMIMPASYASVVPMLGIGKLFSLKTYFVKSVFGKLFGGFVFSNSDGNNGNNQPPIFTNVGPAQPVG